MSNSKCMMDVVSKMGANKWLHLDEVKITITLSFLYTQLFVVYINKRIKEMDGPE